MDTKIIVIEDNRIPLSKNLGYSGIEYNNQTEDHLIHKWLIPKLSELKNLEKIIIPIRLGLDDSDFKGLRIGLHIRLSPELGDKRYLPIIFIGEESRDSVIQNQIDGDKERTGMLLFTPGVYMTSIIKLQEKIQNFNTSINKEVLSESVLPNLIIENQKDLGHQLANEWGMFRLAKFAGITLNIEPPYGLFFKYKYAFTETNVIPENKTNIGLVHSDCKALIIDDNADKGWKDLLEEIIKKRVIAVGKKCRIESVLTFEEVEKKTDFEQFDIIFLDLRLKPEEDKPNTNLPIEEYSGYKLLKKIKTENKGIQVIILTASNKAWNMKRLLEAGADGYYIKESPVIQMNDDLSRENYKDFISEINNCLKRGYLKEVFGKTKQINDIIDLLQKKKCINKGFAESVSANLTLSYKLLNAAKENTDFAFAYLSLFKVLEQLNDYYIIKNDKDIWEITIAENLEQFKWEKNKYVEITPLKFNNNTPTTFEKLAGFCFQVLKFNQKQVEEIFWCVQRRNAFVHPEKKDKDNTKKYKNEIKKIYKEEGYQELLASIYTMFEGLKCR